MGDVGIVQLQELDQPVLHLDVVVRARNGEPGRRFQAAAGGVVQLSDQGSQIQTHDFISVNARVRSNASEGAMTESSTS